MHVSAFGLGIYRYGTVCICGGINVNDSYTIVLVWCVYTSCLITRGMCTPEKLAFQTTPHVRAVQSSSVPTGIAFRCLSISRCQFQALLALFL